MNRRTFLCGLGKFIGSAALVATAPKFIFDPQANLYRLNQEMVTIEWKPFVPSITEHVLAHQEYISTAYYKQIGKVVYIKFEGSRDSLG